MKATVVRKRSRQLQWRCEMAEEKRSWLASFLDEFGDIAFARIWDRLDFDKIARSWAGKIPLIDVLGLGLVGVVEKLLTNSGHPHVAKLTEGIGDFFQRIQTAKTQGGTAAASVPAAPPAATGFFGKVLQMKNSVARSNLLRFVKNLAKDRPQTAVRFQGEIGKMEPAELDDLALSLFSLDEIAQTLLALHPEKPDKDWDKSWEDFKNFLSPVGSGFKATGRGFKKAGQAVAKAADAEGLEDLEKKTARAADILCPWRWGKRER